MYYENIWKMSFVIVQKEFWAYSKLSKPVIIMFRPSNQLEVQFRRKEGELEVRINSGVLPCSKEDLGWSCDAFGESYLNHH